MRAKHFQDLSKPKKKHTVLQPRNNGALSVERAAVAHARLMKKVKQVLARHDAALSPVTGGCRKKKSYPTAAVATKVAITTISRSGGKLSLRVYQCERCGKWHLTSKALKVTQLQKKDKGQSNNKRET